MIQKHFIYYIYIRTLIHIYAAVNVIYNIYISIELYRFGL